MLRLCLTLAAALAVTLVAPAAGQGAAVPGVPLVEPSAIGAQSAPSDERAGTPEGEAPAEEPAAQEPSSRAAQVEGDEGSVEDGSLTGDEAAPEGTAAQAGDRDCGDFDSQQEAQDFFEENGGSPDNNVDRLDADGDGEACEDFSFTVDDGDEVDDGDDEPAPRGGIDTGLGGPAGERGRSVPGLLGLCLLAVSGVLAVGRRRRQPRPTAR